MTNTAPAPVKGGNISTENTNYKGSGYSKKEVFINRAGILSLLYAIVIAIYAPISLAVTAADRYKTSTPNADTFIMNTFDIQKTFPIEALLVMSAIVLGAFGIFTLVSALSPGDMMTRMLSVIFFPIFVLIIPLMATLGIVNSVHQPQVTSSFEEWLKTDHNIVLDSTNLKNPLEIASQPRVLHDTKGNPTIVTFKVDGSTITFLQATPK